MTTRYIGIDFGTSTTVVRYKDYLAPGTPVDNNPPLKVDFNNHDIVPTLITEAKNGSDRFGWDAVNAYGNVRSGFKMGLSSHDPQRRQEAMDLMTKFFHYLHGEYERQKSTLGPVGREVTYVSYPAKWSPPAREAVIKAATVAGFPDVNSWDEPSAALHYCLQHKRSSGLTAVAELQSKGILLKDKPAVILLADLGAGTTDIVLFRYRPSDSQVNI